MLQESIEEVVHFKFDGVFLPASQEEVFAECRDLMQSAFDGYNFTIFAYGQTGAGKTYTMMGNAKAPGLALRLAGEIFKIAEGQSEHCDHKIKISMLELYK